MARIEFAPEVIEDIDRILDHLRAHGVADRDSRIQAIIQAVDALAGNPQIGRRLPDGKRELVIGRGARGYLALYRYIDEIDIVFILALRSQTEAAYVVREN